MKSPFHSITHANKTFDHFHKHLHHAFVIILLAIVGMLWGASNTLSTTSASWQWGGFLSAEFWEQNPSNENIIYSLFGNGNIGSTAYTQTWDESCIPNNVIILSTGYHGGSLDSSNSVYILSSGEYTLTEDIIINNNCIALIGKPNTFINQGQHNILIENKNKVIVDSIFLQGSLDSTGIQLNGSKNITLNNLDLRQHDKAISNTTTGFITLNNSRLFFNKNAIYTYNGTTASNNILIINNSQIYNNQHGINSSVSVINNSQIFNNTTGISALFGVINNSILYNNILGASNQIISNSNAGLFFINNSSLYNNTTAIKTETTNYYFGTLKFFANDSNLGGSETTLSGSNSPITFGSWSDGQLETGAVALDYQWFTNPQDGSGEWLLSGINNNTLRGINAGFLGNNRPIRYIFGSNILKQAKPILCDVAQTSFSEYGNDNLEYKTTKYIAEPESSLHLQQQTLVNQYFGSDSKFTENWENNECSLSAFQIIYLNPTTFSSGYMFEDHTLYILSSGEYKSTITQGNAFTFNGNCIALIGNENTRFTKAGGGISSVLYANNKHNIIIDGIKVDGTYNGTASPGGTSYVGIKLEGTTNNSTLNNIQVYNNADYGVYLGLGSSYTTLMNIQAFNNTIAGIYLYYSSTYNVINNVQTYNNGMYGIWFANGSSRNTINNFQSYNNTIGVFGDLTTSENVINKAAIYNNSTAGIYFKNSSGNMINNTRIYNNQRGIKTLYNSANNQYHGTFELYNNLSGNFDGTNADDETLFAGAGLFAYPGTIYTGNALLGCSYATNPLISTTSETLLTGTCNTIGYNSTFFSPYNTNIQYTFGLDMHKQSIPVKYNVGGGLEEIPSQYDENKYIAERFAIRDKEPENISFVFSGNIELDTRNTSAVYTANTINTVIDIELSLIPNTASGYLIINGENVGYTGTIENGDTLEIAIHSATGYNQTIEGTIVLGDTSTNFMLTTKNYNQLPTTGSLIFSSFTSLEINTITGSTTTIAGLETGTYASISFEPSTTLGRLEIYSGTTFINSGTTGLLVYNGNQIKVQTQSSSSYGSTISGNVNIGWGTGSFTLTTKGGDIVAPSTPTISYPLSGEYMFFVSFDWNPSTDTGSGIEGYMYEIANDNNFMDIAHIGFITTQTGTSGSPDTNFTSKSGKRYFRIKAKDRDGNYSNRSNTGFFRILSLVDRTLPEITGANLISYYTSDVLQVKGISSGVSLRASVSSNALLYKNGEERGTGAYVQNDDLLYLKIKSSNNYNTVQTGIITLANRLVNFSVKTKISALQGCTLSDDDREHIEAIFDSMVDNYKDNPEQYEDFLYTMQSMLQDEINFNNNCNLMYLQDLVKQALGLSQIIISTGAHIAPNCKEYAISYDIDTYTYTSPTFMHPIYFANRDTLTTYIDSKNPGDCHINTYVASSRNFTNNDPNKHIAPNGKIYAISIASGKYTSENFMTQKYFTTLSELRQYIDKNNMPSSVWNHQVDTTFTPQTYTAPNTKEYKIYKTNRGYMSYKLLKVQYFSSLTDIQSYISKNNPR